jgi:hypothetical protein
MFVAAGFTVVNVLGAGYAIAMGEALHAGGHVALSVIGAMVMAWMLPGRMTPSPTPLAEDRLQRLQQSVDAIALEVERIGESQRYTAKLDAERAKALQPRPGQDAS